ncbi:hypothetical protein C0J52_07162 [Blattella germanica]|nr:hypothetical protein C0J52_07162 [Blattella germanica]
MSTSTPKMTNVEKEVAEEYASSLSDLTVNSKPLINMLTMLAHENITYAPVIVQTVERHLQQVPAERKLPVLYLIDSIVKNVGDTYTTLFTQNIVSTFCSVFEKVDEKTRANMFKLRQTWNEVFPAKKLYAVDVRVNSIDPAWPITAVPPTIHVNPKFFRQQQPTTTAAQTTTTTATTVTTTPSVSTVTATVTDDSQTINEAKMREQLLKKQKELLELQQKKLELELLQTKARLEEQQKQLDRQLRPENVPVRAFKIFILYISAVIAITLELIWDVYGVLTSKPAQSSSNREIYHYVVKALVEVKMTKDSNIWSTFKIRWISIKFTFKRLKFFSGFLNIYVMNNSKSSIEKRSTTFLNITNKKRGLHRSTEKGLSVPKKEKSEKKQQDEEMQEPDTVFEAVKLETTKPKPQITINLGCVNKDSPPPKISDLKEENIPNKDKDSESSSKNSSPSKVENLKKKSSPVGSSRSSSSLVPASTSSSSAVDRKKGLGKTINESLNMGGNSSNYSIKRERGKSPSSGEKRHNREHIASTKFNMFVESEGESPSPPPPPVISENKKREESSSTKSSAFKDVKVSTKSRNYVRRNRRSKSRSPDITPVVATGDVDLRVCGPPEKHPRLNVFQPDTKVSTATPEEDIKINI